MDQKDFLRLMTTQLTTQDPFNPVDNTQMVAQMAQFSQVAGIAEMNKSLAEVAAALARAGSPTRRAGSAGRCWSRADVATPLRDGAYAGEIDAARGCRPGQRSASSTTRAPSSTARTSAPQKAGALAFAWDGKGPNGQPSRRPGRCGRRQRQRRRRPSPPPPPPGPASPASSRPPMAARRPRHRPRPAQARRAIRLS
jgi:hypothetical protein